MGRTTSRRSQWGMVVSDALIAVLGISLAVSDLHEGNLVGAAFTLAISGLLTWSGVIRWRTLQGRAEPPRRKRLRGVVIGLLFGTTSVLLMIESFVGRSFRGQVGSVGANVLGGFWAAAAGCWFLVSWMVWTGRTRVPAQRS